MDPIYLDTNVLIALEKNDMALAGELVSLRNEGHKLLIVPAVRHEALYGNPLKKDAPMVSPDSRAAIEQAMRIFGIEVDWSSASLPMNTRVGVTMQEHNATRKSGYAGPALRMISEADSLVLAQVKASAQVRGITNPTLLTTETGSKGMLSQAERYGVKPRVRVSQPSVRFVLPRMPSTSMRVPVPLTTPISIPTANTPWRRALGNQAVVATLGYALQGLSLYLNDQSISYAVDRELRTTHAAKIAELRKQGTGFLVIIRLKRWALQDDRLPVAMLMSVSIEPADSAERALNNWMEKPKWFQGVEEPFWQVEERYVWTPGVLQRDTRDMQSGPNQKVAPAPEVPAPASPKSTPPDTIPCINCNG